LYGAGLGAKKNSNDDSLIEYEGFDLYRESLTLEQHKTLDNILSQLSDSQIVEKLKNIDVNTLTPIEAMGILYDLTKQANN
jgi:hypothetical protein